MPAAAVGLLTLGAVMKTQEERIADLEREVAELKAMMPSVVSTDVVPVAFRDAISFDDIRMRLDTELYAPMARIEVLQ